MEFIASEIDSLLALNFIQENLVELFKSSVSLRQNLIIMNCDNCIYDLLCILVSRLNAKQDLILSLCCTGLQLVCT